MSDEHEDLNTDTGSYSLDDDNQLQPEDTLVDGDLEDVLDRGYSPPDRPVGSVAWGTTAWEQSQEETIDQRILQEVPDPDSAYGAPDNESGLDEGPDGEQPDRVGGDDPDGIPAEDDFVGDSGRRSGRLVAPDEGLGEDTEKDEVAEDVGIDGAGASAEEAAMHIVSEDAVAGLDNDESDALSDESAVQRIEEPDDPEGLHADDDPSELDDLQDVDENLEDLED